MLMGRFNSVMRCTIRQLLADRSPPPAVTTPYGSYFQTALHGSYVQTALPNEKSGAKVHSPLETLITGIVMSP